MKDQINNQMIHQADHQTNYQTNYKMKAKKRNGFWTFCFSFVPGCAEMYWGFMQAGMSLLLPFVGVIFLAYFLSTDELMFVDVVIYIYAFFHARNMAHMTEEEVRATEDGGVNLFAGLGINAGGLKKRQTAKWGGLIMIVYGVYELLHLIYYSVPFPDWLNYYFRNFLHFFPKGATAVVLIILGVKLIAGKKLELEQETIREESVSDVSEKMVRETMEETAREAARIVASEATQSVPKEAAQEVTLRATQGATQGETQEATQGETQPTTKEAVQEIAQEITQSTVQGVPQSAAPTGADVPQKEVQHEE